MKTGERFIVINAAQGFAALAILFFAAGATADESRSGPRKRGDKANSTRPVNAIDGDGNTVKLPNPPDDLAEWIDLGTVRFEFYDPKLVHRSFAGETEFEFQYAYDSRSTWRRKDKDGKVGIEVSIRYHDIRLQRSHRVLLPQEMIGDDFFQRRLTKHEFDHVRISADPRLPGLLESMLNERNSVVMKWLDEEEDGFKGKPSSQDMARISKQLVNDESDRVFNDFVAVVSIRYRELDRVSKYGIEPLSAEDRERIIDSAPSPTIESTQ